MGGARAVWEIGPKNIFTLPNGVVFNTNPHAQAYENAFGILFDDHNVGRAPGRRRRRIRDARRARHERLAPRPRPANVRRAWDLRTHCSFTRSPADREQNRRAHGRLRRRLAGLLRRIDRTTTRSSRTRTSCSCSARTATATSSTGCSATTRATARRSRASRRSTACRSSATCSAVAPGPGARRGSRGVTIADRAECFNNRMRGVESAERTSSRRRK